MRKQKTIAGVKKAKGNGGACDLTVIRPISRRVFLSGAMAGSATAIFFPAQPGLTGGIGAGGNRLTARDVTRIVFEATPGVPANFAQADLTNLDLSTVDFKKAILTKSDLYGADLTDANMAGVDLSGVRMDRATIIRTNFSGANLEGASLLRPTVFTDLSFAIHDAPNFVGARMAGIRVVARLDGADFSGADMTGANFSRRERKDGLITTIPRIGMLRGKLRDVKLAGADMRDTVLLYSDFTNADLSGVNFRTADLTEADLSGADVTGANFYNADLYGTKLSDAIGLDNATGLDKARNFDKAKT